MYCSQIIDNGMFIPNADGHDSFSCVPVHASEQQACFPCRRQQGVDPARGAREQALQHEGFQKLPGLEERLPHPPGQCTEQAVCRHQLADHNHIWSGHVSMVNACAVDH